MKNTSLGTTVPKYKDFLSNNTGLTNSTDTPKYGVGATTTPQTNYGTYSTPKTNYGTYSTPKTNYGTNTSTYGSYNSGNNYNNNIAKDGTYRNYANNYGSQQGSTGYANYFTGEGLTDYQKKNKELPPIDYSKARTDTTTGTGLYSQYKDLYQTAGNKQTYAPTNYGTPTTYGQYKDLMGQPTETKVDASASLYKQPQTLYGNYQSNPVATPPVSTQNTAYSDLYPNTPKVETPTTGVYSQYADLYKQKETDDKTALDAYNRNTAESYGSYLTNKSTYGANAEALARMGMQGSGYSDYLDSQAYSNYRNEIEQSKASYSDALKTNQATFDSGVTASKTNYTNLLGEALTDGSNFSYVMSSANALGLSADQQTQIANEMINYKLDSGEISNVSDLEKVANSLQLPVSKIEAYKKRLSTNLATSVDNTINSIKNDTELSEDAKMTEYKKMVSDIDYSYEQGNLDQSDYNKFYYNMISEDIPSVNSLDGLQSVISAINSVDKNGDLKVGEYKDKLMGDLKNLGLSYETSSGLLGTAFLDVYLGDNKLGTVANGNPTDAGRIDDSKIGVLVKDGNNGYYVYIKRLGESSFMNKTRCRKLTFPNNTILDYLYENQVQSTTR